MKKEKRMTLGGFLLALLFIVSASVGSFADMAEAAPPRVSWKQTQTSLVKSEAGEHLIKIRITFTNNSTDEKAIIKLYDKILKISGTIIDYTGAVTRLNNYIVKSSKVNNIDLWPGKIFNLTFSIPLKDVLKDKYQKSWNWRIKDIKVNSCDFKYATKSI